MKLKLLFFLFVSTLSVGAQQLIHNFEFNDNLTDTQPSGLQLGSVGTTTDSYNQGVWNWTSTNLRGGGLVLNTAGLVNPLTYTLRLQFSFAETGTGYKKIISFNGESADAGLYFLANQLKMYPYNTIISNTTYTANTLYDLVITRELNDSLKIYQLNDNAQVVKCLALKDSSKVAVPLLISGKYEFRFFMDDLSTSTENTTGGSVSQIRLWDAAMTYQAVVASESKITADDLKYTITNGKLSVSGVPSDKKIYLYNLQGIMIDSKSTEEGSLEFSLPTKGIYLLKVGYRCLKVLY